VKFCHLDNEDKSVSKLNYGKIEGIMEQMTANPLSDQIKDELKCLLVKSFLQSLRKFYSLVLLVT
jgi:hypothetical protein